MKTVLLRAPVFSKSGYGEHSRQIYRYLRSKNIDLYIQPLSWGWTPWFVNRDDCDGIIGEMQEKSNFTPNKKYDVTIQCQLPNEWDPSLGKYNIGVTAGVESDICNPNWSMIHVNKMDKVIVPSNFTKEGLTSQAKPNTEVCVVPESYYNELLSEVHEDILSGINTEFNFLTVGVLTGHEPETDRKNLFYLIKWFVEEFKTDDDVGLIIKTNTGRDTTIDKIKTRRLLSQVLKELGVVSRPKVYLIHGEMSREEMTSLYKSKKVKCYLTATRGEGFGLPILEAAIAGLPVIGTDWSAHTEFMNLGKWLSVQYELKEVHEKRVDGEIFVKGSKWAEIKEKDFKEKMRKFYKSSSMPTTWAKNLSEKLISEYSQSSIEDHYDRHISEVLK